ncbi:hypothetical protein BE221DRAFT_8521 [Ostreococcus tauri]|uniref:BP28 C-terminal domain-containing protein n=1 Tax=Ostreococcus tauri TaxID=70448 RepID=A0A1Y5IB75_OSTTA|nr:hypothetical protein BE221DRAFT_8521 [Ostreococcus tauri]
MAPVTALASALRELKSRTSVEAGASGKSRVSLLHDAREAATIDRETTHAVAVRGFEELCRRDGRFEAHARALFSKRAAEGRHRELEDAARLEATSAEVRAYLRLLSGYFTERAAGATIEWLIRRFKVHVYDVDDLIACGLPWHSTAAFVRCVQTCQLENSKHFKWLNGVKETGAPPPREALAVRCSRDKAFFTFCAQSAAEMATTKGNVGTTSAFYAVLITEALGLMQEVDASVTSRLLPYLEAGLASAANSEQFAGALMVATQLAARTQMGAPLVEALLEGIVKGTRVPLHSQSLQAMLALCQTQRVRALPERAFKHLVKIPELEELVADLLHNYRADAFSLPLMRSLAEFADVHANYERVLRAVIEKVPLSGKHFIVIIPILLATAKKSDEAGEMVTSVLKLADQHRPLETSEAVDFVFRGSAARKSKEPSPDSSAKKKDKLLASVEDAAFLRAALLGSASGPMQGHATSIHAALDHPNASLRESAIVQLGKLAVESRDENDELPSALCRGSALGPAMLRRVTDDDPRVAAAAMELDPLRQMVNNDGALFAAAKARLATAMTVLVSGGANGESERRVAKRALRLTLGVLSKSDDGSAPSALASRAAALAYEHALFSNDPALRNVTKAALNAARGCPHPSMDGVRSDELRGVAEDSKSNKDGDARRAFEHKCNEAVLAALGDSLSKEWSKDANECDRGLWIREVYRDANAVGRANLLMACKHAVEKTSGKSTAIAVALRNTSWSIISDSWSEDGVSESRGIENDEMFAANASPDAKFASALNASEPAARRALPAIHRSLLRATLDGLPRKGSDEADKMLPSCFRHLAMTDAVDKQTGRSIETMDSVIGELLRHLLSACDRCYGGAGSSAFLASQFASDPAFVDPRVQVAALELCASCSKMPSISSVIVAAASSSSPVRTAAAALLSAYSREQNASSIVKSLVAASDEIALKGTAALCRAVADGVNKARAPGDELAAFLEPVQEIVSEPMPSMDAYGARCLIATTRGMGDVTRKASILLSILSWCVQESDASTASKSSLAMEILNIYTPEYAKTFGASGGEGWRVLTRCMVTPSPPAVRASAFAIITPDFVAELKSKPKAELLSILFSAVNADSDDVSRREAQNAVDALVIDSKDVAKTVNAALESVPASKTPAKKKGKTSGEDVAASLSLGSAEAMRAATVALEVLAWKMDKTQHLDALVGPCQHFLEALMNDAAARAKARETADDDSDTDSSDDAEAGTAAGGYLEALTLRTLESLAQARVKDARWNVPLIIRAVREVDEGAARSAALACLAEIAHAAPDAVLEHVFDVGSALSDRAATSDDVLSQRALESALVAVVPVWLKSGESLKNVVSRLVESLPLAPARRRAPICAALVQASPEGEALPAIILNLIRRSKSLETSAREARMRVAAVVDQSDAPMEDDAWVEELLDTLLVREAPLGAVSALVSALKESALEGGRFVRACADAASKHLSSMRFIRSQKVISAEDTAELQEGYASLASSAIVLLQSVGAKEDTPKDRSKSKSPGKSPEKAAAKAEASGQNLLSALNGLLAPGPFLRALTPLLDHNEGRVRRKALALVTERLQNASGDGGDEDDAETQAGIALLSELSSLIQSKSVTTSQAALMALEAAVVRFSHAQAATNPLLSVVPAVIAQLSVSSATLRASAALTLATLVKILGIRTASVINTAMPALLNTSVECADALREKDLDGEVFLVVHSCLAAIRMFVNNVAGFISPFLGDIIKVALHPSIVLNCGDDKSHESSELRALQELALAIRGELPQTIELRLLIRPLVESWDICLTCGGDEGASSCAALLEIISAAGDSDKATNAHRQQLFSVVLRGLDVRREGPVGASEKALDYVEANAVSACVTLALKCTESEFLPFFLQCVEWARARAGEASVTRTRLAALFRLAASLADELRAVFVPFFRHLLDLAAVALDIGADPSEGKKKRKSSGAEALSENDIWRMRKWTLAALRRCFQYDNVGFLDSNRYNMLYPLISEQLKASPPTDSEEDDYDTFMREGSFGVEVVGACASLLCAAPDDAHWKPLHRAILMTGREEKVRSRVFTIQAIEQIVDKLQEEYLALLPEAIPFMAELMEDLEPEIERMARKLTKRLSDLAGEDLKTLMRDGFKPKAEGKKEASDSEESDSY